MGKRGSLIKNCLVCRKEIFRGNSKRKKKVPPYGVTCGGKCSITYARISRYIKNQIKIKERLKENDNKY